MKIDFTSQEYKKLLDILYIADWVMNAHKFEDDPKTKPYKGLEQKILSYAKGMGFEEMVEYAADQKEYFPTRKFEESSPAMTLIEEFENESFWEALISRLADRDLIRQMGGVEKLSQLSFEERMKKTMAIEEKYASEFEDWGLDNLYIVRNKEKKT